MEKLIGVLVTAAITAGVMFLEAQWIVWGLSMYHINSGIWPVYLIAAAVEGIMVLGVASGIRAARD
jgi:hypothetical protein